MTIRFPAAILMSCLISVTITAEDVKRPNILFIIVDDQSPFDLKIYNPKSSLQTPTLDRLAAEGMVFDGAYHMGSFSGAVCTPSRHMVMSGRTVWHLPISPEAAKNDRCPDHLELQTIPAVFNRAGYDTMRTCKTRQQLRSCQQTIHGSQRRTKRGGDDETGSAWHAEQVLNYLQ